MSKSRSQSENNRSSWCLKGGLLGLLVWLVGGLTLESFHGLKAALYLEDDLRREMWTLAHSHGTLFSVICLVLFLLQPFFNPKKAALADKLFAVAAWMMPIGFFAGGLTHSESDPGIAILFLVPPGGLMAAAALGILLTGQREKD